MKFIASPEEHGSYSGKGTFYNVGLGSCGDLDTDDELVVAVNKAQMDNGANPNKNPKCEHMVSISGTDGSVVARIVDACPSCAEGALDMSPTVFEKVCGELGKGTCGITWSFL
ncbi:hypothetical protein K501DRAFT_171428 [Backusella circina FSU 941]|nr:hypothetical protein K501DRAFT_171428 [Backusella circina FSU 941]